MCTGIERVYVHEQVYDHFVAELTRRARELRPGTDAGSSYGPMTLPGQLDVVRRHISDALNRGGRAVVGGADAVGERTVAPTVLLDVPEDSDAVREETFGPTLTVNASAYGLGSAVFSRQHGDRIAGRLRVGMCSVNSVIGFAAMPSVPFGGRGASGFGRVHGPDGLREFAYPRSVARQRFALPVAVQSFRRTERTDRLLARVIRLRHGRRR
jgi:acyl-CoA reductase-like NAD-dependent aldehyde dehydrogenase